MTFHLKKYSHNSSRHPLRTFRPLWGRKQVAKLWMTFISPSCPLSSEKSSETSKLWRKLGSFQLPDTLVDRIPGTEGQKQAMLARKVAEALACTIAAQFLHLSLRW